MYVHWHVLAAVTVLSAASLRAPIYGLLGVASYLAVIVVHEVGHAAVAHRLGYELLAIRIGLVHGRCEFEHPDFEWDEARVAWGGVGAQAGVAAVVFTISAVRGDAPAAYFGPIVVFLGYLNVIVAIANLVPVKGLDGAVAWRVFPLLLERIRAASITRKALRRVSRRR